MKIILRTIRKDGKLPVLFIFDNGIRINKIIPNKDYPTIDGFLKLHAMDIKGVK